MCWTDKVEDAQMGQASNGAKRANSLALAFLAIASGSMDGIAYTKLGQVFTSAMSGNTVLCGLALGERDFAAASHALAALAAYAVGVVLAGWPLRKPASGAPIVLAVEAVLLGAFAILWRLRGGPDGDPMTYGFIALSALAMGMQGALARHVQAESIPTVVVTSTLTASIGTTAERLLAGARPAITGKAWRQSATFLVYLGSAVLVGLAVPQAIDLVPFLPVIALLAVLLGWCAGWFAMR